MQADKKLKRSEMIGRNIEVTSSKNKSSIGLKGKIIDETKNTLTIKTDEGERKTLIKSAVTIQIKKNNEKITIKGEEIQLSPEERIKIR